MALPQKVERMIQPTCQLSPTLLCGGHVCLLELSEHSNGGFHTRRSQSNPQVIKPLLNKMTLVPIEPPTIPLKFGKQDAEISLMCRQGGREKQYIVHVIYHFRPYSRLNAMHSGPQCSQKFMRTIVVAKWKTSILEKATPH